MEGRKGKQKRVEVWVRGKGLLRVKGVGRSIMSRAEITQPRKKRIYIRKALHSRVKRGFDVLLIM